MHDFNFIGKIVKDCLGRNLAFLSGILSNSGDYGYIKDVSIYKNDFNNLFSLDNLACFYSSTDQILPLNTSPSPNFEEDSDMSLGDMALCGNILNMSDVPLYNQLDYKGVPYGVSDVANSGCGITCLAMLTSYKRIRMIFSAELSSIVNNVCKNHQIDNVRCMLTAADELVLSNGTVWIFY